MGISIDPISHAYCSCLRNLAGSSRPVRESGRHCDGFQPAAESRVTRPCQDSVGPPEIRRSSGSSRRTSAGRGWTARPGADCARIASFLLRVLLCFASFPLFCFVCFVCFFRLLLRFLLSCFGVALVRFRVLFDKVYGVEGGGVFRSGPPQFRMCYSIY